MISFLPAHPGKQAPLVARKSYAKLPQILEIPNPNHPYGVRGVGETSIVPPLAAIGNAISNAVGVRMDHVPMSPPRILKALDQLDAS